MNRNAYIAIVFLGFIKLAMANDTSTQEKYSNLLEQANVAYKNSNYAEALIYLKNFTQKIPDNLSARILMAEVLIASGRGTSAEVELNIANGLGADKNRTILLFAEAYLLQGKYKEVLTLLDNPVQEEILASKIFLLKGHAYLGLRRLKLSNESYQQALDLNSSNQDAKLGLAQVQLNYYQYKKAQIYVDEVINGYFPPIKAWILKASIHQSLSELDYALTAINKALLENPNHIQALILRASLYIELINYEGALQDINNVFRQVPNEPKAQFLFAMIEARKEDGDPKAQLLKLSETLSRLDEDTLKNNPSYYYLTSIVAFQQGNYSAADQYIRNYLLVDTQNIKAINFSATINMAMGNYTVAQSILNKGNLIEENNAKTLSLLGLSSLELKQYEKANFYFQKVLELFPESSLASQQLAKNSIEMGEYDKAITILRSINSSAENQATTGFLLVQAYVKSGKIQLAVELSEKLVKLQPSNKEFLHHLGFIYQIAGNLEEAQKSFEKSLKIDPLHIKSIISLSKIMQVKGQSEASLKLLIDALKVQENNSELIEALGQGFAADKQFKQSILWFEKAYKLNASNKNILKQLSLSYIADGNMTEAVEVLESYLVNNEKSADIYILLGQHYQYQKNVQKSLFNYTQSMKYDADKAEVYFYIAKLFQANDQIKDAIEAYQKSIAWAGNKQPQLLAVTQLLNETGSPLQAIELIRNFAGNDELSNELQQSVAHSYYLSGQFSEAETIYKKQLSTNSDSVIAGLSLVYQANKQTNKAVALLQNYLKSSPQSLLLNTSLAEIYIGRKQWQQAYNLYLTLLNNYPGQAALLNNAAYIALSLELFDEAKVHILASLALIKDQSDSLDTLGWVYYLTKEYDKALPLFRQALAIDFSKMEIKYHLALTLKALNRDKEAFNSLREVVNNKRDFEGKDNAISLLAEWSQDLGQ